MLQGFKDFISRGNVIDLAVGVMIGGAFSPVISALTDKVLMPLIAAIFGKPSFDQLFAFSLNGTLVQPGILITAIVNFLIVAAALYFFVVLPMNKLNEKRNAKNAADTATAAAEAEKDSPAEILPDDVALLREIRDLLAAKINSAK